MNHTYEQKRLRPQSPFCHARQSAYRTMTELLDREKCV